MSPLTERFELRLDPEILLRIDEWRSGQAGLPSRAEAIRRLVEAGLSPEESGQGLRFSAGETLLTHMLCELFKAQRIKSDINVEFLQEALYGGHLWGLQWNMTGVFHNHVDAPEIAIEVSQILDMWEFIESSFEKLSKADKALVKKEANLFGDPQFHGFDGNTESEHMGVAMFMVSRMGRFERFKDREMNSHMPVGVGRQRRMLAKFGPMRPLLAGTTLTAAQLVELLKTRKKG